MKNFGGSKHLAALFLAGSLTVTSLSGCSFSGNTQDPRVLYEKTLDDMQGKENQAVMDYINSIPFSNESFRTSFYTYLAEGSGNWLINANLNDVVNIELSNVDSIEDLRLFPKLRTLTIKDSNINDLSILSTLPNLEEIKFDSMTVNCSKIKDVKVKTILFNKVNFENIQELSELKNVEVLEIDYSHTHSIDFIKNWKNLKSLYLCNADIDNYDVISSKNLKSLIINFCQVNDWSFIKDLSGLEKLNVAYTNFSDSSLLTNLSKLNELDLSYSLVSSLDGIKNLNKLKSLNIDSCQSLTDISEIDGLKKLEYLNCTNMEMQADTYYTCNEYYGFDAGVKKDVIKLYNSLNITDDTSDEEKIRRIIIAILDLLEYDLDTTPEEVAYYNNHELLSALDGFGMCPSYTGLTCALLDLAGIENCSIVGENIEDNELYLHRWVVVKIDDKWLGLDPTFLDDINASDNLKNGEYPDYYLSELSDDVWMEYHYPYFMPDTTSGEVLNLAK